MYFAFVIFFIFFSIPHYFMKEVLQVDPLTIFFCDMICKISVAFRQT